MKKLLLLFTIAAITASASAQFKKSGSMDIMRRFNNGSIVLSKRTQDNAPTIYYITMKDATHNYAFYLDPVKLGDKESAVAFFKTMLNGWADMKAGDEFPDLGLPDGQTGFCRSSFGSKVFCVICNSIGGFGEIYKLNLNNIIYTLEED